MPKKTEIPLNLHGNAKVRIYSRDHTHQILLMFLQGVLEHMEHKSVRYSLFSVQIWGISITFIECT